MEKQTKKKFERVSKKKPCPICGKSDWCLIANDGSAVICPRISHGAIKYIEESGYLHKLNDNGGYVKRMRKKIKKRKITKTSRVTRPTKTRFVYKDEKGNKLLSEVRIDYPSKRKKVWYERWDGDKWIRGIADPITKKPLVRKVLYNLIALLGPDRFNEYVLIVEGPNKVVLLRKMGFIATCSPGGAGKWRDEYSLYLSGCDVVILPDNDEPGKKHARQVRDSLIGHAKSIRIVQLPELPHAGDIVDWFTIHGKTTTSIKEFKKIIENTEPVSKDQIGDQPVLLKVSDIKSRETSWLWENRIALGELNIIAGNPGIGKSFLTLNLAAKVSSGSPMPGSRLRKQKHSVILLSAEDDPERTIRPRLDTMNADVRRIILLKSVRKCNENDEHKI